MENGEWKIENGEWTMENGKLNIQTSNFKTIPYSLFPIKGINLRRKLPYGADPSLQGFHPIYQSILFRLTLVAPIIYILFPQLKLQNPKLKLQT